MEWIIEHSAQLLIAFGLFVSGGLVVAKLTKNKTDDKVFGLLKQVLNSLTAKK